MVSSVSALRPWRVVLVAVVSLLALTACALEIPEVAEISPNEKAATMDLNRQDSSDHAVHVERLELTTQESTFLSGIEDARRELGDPEAHRFVEFPTSGDVLWQGERLVYEVRDVLFLQQAAGDGLSAVRIDIPSGANFDQERDLSNELAVPRGRMVDVEILDVRARPNHDGDDGSASWSFDVTVTHPDTGWEDYVDGWHVETTDGRILGTRILLHPHVGEQPFTRSLSNVTIPADVEEVRIRAHDLVSGYGPAGEIITLDGSGTENDQANMR
jgi:hypothetical protein